MCRTFQIDQLSVTGSDGAMPSLNVPSPPYHFQLHPTNIKHQTYVSLFGQAALPTDITTHHGCLTTSHLKQSSIPPQGPPIYLKQPYPNHLPPPTRFGTSLLFPSPHPQLTHYRLQTPKVPGMLWHIRMTKLRLQNRTNPKRSQSKVSFMTP